MLENKFKTGLIRELKERFPGCMVVHLDPNEIQGIPDLLVLYGTTWGALEGKKSASAPHRPNQDYYVQQMDEMSFAAFIYPENKEEVLNELARSFEAHGETCPPRSKYYHWLNYDADRLTNAVLNYQAKERGTRLHAFAAECIDLKQKLPKNKKTLNTYVNDAIGFRMDTEQVLYYSDNCYGTADAISFNDGFLRIHDLKTGAVPAHMEQLYIYAALFCLEYGYHPKDIRMELRIYQNDEVWVENPTEEEISPVIAKIKEFDPIITDILLGVAA